MLLITLYLWREQEAGSVLLCNRDTGIYSYVHTSQVLNACTDVSSCRCEAWKGLSDTVQGLVWSPTLGRAQVCGQTMSYYPQSRESRAVKIQVLEILQ